MQEWLIHFGASHQYLIYAVIIILACAEGPILSMIFGVLIRLGYFKFAPVYAALMVGDLLGDVIWYYIGFHFGHRFVRRFGKYFGITEEGVNKMTHLFHRFHSPILFISKISNGLGLAIVTLMTAGMVRIPFLKYLSVNLIGQFIWSGLLIGVGYFFSHLYIQFDNILSRASIIGFAIIFIIAAVRLQKYFRNKAEKLDA